MKIRNNKRTIGLCLLILCCIICMVCLLALPDWASRADESIGAQDSDVVAQATASESISFEPTSMYLKSEQQTAAELLEGRTAIHVAAGQTLCLDVELDRSASYYIEVEYYVPGSMLMTTKASVYVNEKLAQSDIPLPAQWMNNTDYALDEFGNELCRMPERVYQWESTRLNSSLYQYRQGVAFGLQTGSNHIEIAISETDIYVSRITLTGYSDITSYQEWLNEQPEKADHASGVLETLEGEHFSFQSNAQIHADKSRDSNLHPFLRTITASTAWMEALGKKRPIRLHGQLLPRWMDTMRLPCVIGKVIRHPWHRGGRYILTEKFRSQNSITIPLSIQATVTEMRSCL